MTELLTAAQMRSLEAAAIACGAVTGLELMERAGRGVVAAVFEQWPALRAGSFRAVVLCGPGNNGGDGFVVARLLKQAGGQVTVLPQGRDALLQADVTPPLPPGDAWINAGRWRDMGGRSCPYTADQVAAALIEPGTTLVIDALLGIGQNRLADAMLRPFWCGWDRMASIRPDNTIHCISVDVPTGYDSDTGALLADTPFKPDLTVTFHAEKPLHRFLKQRGYKVVVKDIGLSSSFKISPPEA